MSDRLHGFRRTGVIVGEGFRPREPVRLASESLLGGQTEPLPPPAANGMAPIDQPMVPPIAPVRSERKIDWLAVMSLVCVFIGLIGVVVLEHFR